MVKMDCRSLSKIYNISCLLTVWENGKILVEHNLADMRAHADKALVANFINNGK